MEPRYIAGDNITFLVVDPDYKASAGWVVKLRLVPTAVGGTAIEITTTAEGDDHRVAVTPAVSGLWAAGTYSWAAWAEQGADVYTISQGQSRIEPNPRTLAAGTDTRSLAVKALADCKEALATFRATKGLTRRYQIGIREVEFSSTSEILAEIRYWQTEVEKEVVAAGGKRRTSGRILARL